MTVWTSNTNFISNRIDVVGFFARCRCFEFAEVICAGGSLFVGNNLLQSSSAVDGSFAKLCPSLCQCSYSFLCVDSTIKGYKRIWDFCVCSLFPSSKIQKSNVLCSKYYDCHSKLIKYDQKYRCCLHRHRKGHKCKSLKKCIEAFEHERSK